MNAVIPIMKALAYAFLGFMLVMGVRIYVELRFQHYTAYGQDHHVTSVINTENVKLLYIVAEQSSLSCWTLTLGTMTQAVTCSNRGT